MKQETSDKDAAHGVFTTSIHLDCLPAGGAIMIR